MHVFSTLQVLMGLAGLASAIPAAVPAGLDRRIPVEEDLDWSSQSLNLHDSRDAAALLATGKASLPQEATNGNSNLGTVDAAVYYKYTEPETKKCPWGSKTAKNANPYTDAPNTGVTRYYDWTVERAWLAPDGVNRSMILVDGSFPGPTIEANWGDMISVTVHNKIVGPVEGTSFHWHGFLQRDTPWEDGVPGVTQCPIAPGEAFTYTFRAELYGSSWWHAHFSAQYTAGLYGAIVVHGPVQPEAKYDTDLGPVLIADYFHADYESIVRQVMSTDSTKILPKSDNNLINGKGVYNCNKANGTTTGTCTPNAGLSKFKFTSGKTYRLRLINAGAEGLQKFSIDNHDLTVISYDFVPIKPYTTKIITLGVGQRADIIVKANQAPGTSYWMRSTMTLKCSLTVQPNALAVVYYENANLDSIPTSTAVVDTTDPCAGDDLGTAIPYYPLAPATAPDAVQTVDIRFGKNATGHSLWSMNNSTFKTDYNSPLLFGLNEGLSNFTFPRERNTYDFGTANSIRIIINNLTPVSHPMHIHGHNMYILSSTTNTTKTTTQAPNQLVNPSNPTRRDVQILPPFGQIVVQIDGDNPGVWPLHCHVSWHVGGGLYMNIIERPDQIAKMQVPDNHVQLCKKWNDFTSKTVVDQIDSGLKLRRLGRVRARLASDEKY